MQITNSLTYIQQMASNSYQKAKKVVVNNSDRIEAAAFLAMYAGMGYMLYHLKDFTVSKGAVSNSTNLTNDTCPALEPLFTNVSSLTTAASSTTVPSFRDNLGKVFEATASILFVETPASLKFLGASIFSGLRNFTILSRAFSNSTNEVPLCLEPLLRTVENRPLVATVPPLVTVPSFEENVTKFFDAAASLPSLKPSTSYRDVNFGTSSEANLSKDNQRSPAEQLHLPGQASIFGFKL